MMTEHCILITGAAKRLGRIFATYLAGRGHTVIIHYGQSKDEAQTLCKQIKALGQKAFLIQGDLSAPQNAAMIIEKAAQAAQRPITAVINNASLFDYDRPEAPDIKISAKAMAVNYQSPVQLIAALAAQLPQNITGVAINLLDQKLWNMNPDFFSYTNSKAALAAATTMMDQAFGEKLRCLGLAPGILFPSFDQSVAEFSAVANQNLRKKPIDPTDLALAAEYILQTPTLRGQVLHIDNGQRFVPSSRDVMFSTRSDP